MTLLRTNAARCGLLAWLIAPLAVVAPAWSLLMSDLGRLGHHDPLVASSAGIRAFVILIGAAGWCWLAACVLTCVRDVRAARRRWSAASPAPARTALRPAFVRLAVATALGSAAFAPASAAGDPVGSPDLEMLSGLHLPDRPFGGRLPSKRPVATVHVVRAGDSLWSIAASRLPPQASDSAVDAVWRAVYAANRDRIGPRPDLIHPGLTLRLTHPQPAPRPDLHPAASIERTHP